MELPQRGQCEPGWFRLSPRGTRQITTFRNDPMIKPKTNKAATRAASDTRVSLVLRGIRRSALWNDHEASYSSHSVVLMMSVNGESPSGSKYTAGFLTSLLVTMGLVVHRSAAITEPTAPWLEVCMLI